MSVVSISRYLVFLFNILRFLLEVKIHIQKQSYILITKNISVAAVYIKQNETPSSHTTKMTLFEHEHLLKNIPQCLILQKLIHNELTLTRQR